MTEGANPAPAPVFSQELREKAEQIISKYPNKRSAVLPLLFLAQGAQGYVTDEGMRAVAELVELTAAEVLAVASFYTMLKKRPQGKYLLSVCRNLPCTHLGGRKVIEALEDRLGVEVGDTTADGVFSLEAAECLATCDGAPSMQINYEDFYTVSPQDALAFVDALQRGEALESVRGQRVKTSREISVEIATAALQAPGTTPDRQERATGGEVPPPDMAAGFRPKVEGQKEEHA